LIKFSAGTPFEVEAVNQAAKALLGFNINAKDVLPTIKALGAAAAAGGGDLQQIAINYGQISAGTKAALIDLKQFISQGIPIWNLLSESIGVSVAEVQELQKQGKITGEVVKRAFEKAASAGGRFATTLEDQSKTFNGLVSTLKSQVNIVFDKFGQTILPAAKVAVKRLVDRMNNLIESFQKFETQQFLQKFAAGFLSIGDALNVGLRNIGAWIKQLKAVGLAFSSLEFLKRGGDLEAGLAGLRRAIDLSNEGFDETINFGEDVNDVLESYRKNLEDVTKAAAKASLEVKGFAGTGRAFGAKKIGTPTTTIRSDEIVPTPDASKVGLSYDEAYQIAVFRSKQGISKLTKVIEKTPLPRLFEIVPQKIATGFERVQAGLGIENIYSGLVPTAEQLEQQRVFNEELAKAQNIGLQFGQTIGAAISFIPDAIANAITSAKSFGDAWMQIGRSLIGIFKRLIADLIKVAIRTAIIGFVVKTLTGSASGFLSGLGNILKSQFNIPELHTGGTVKKGGIVSLSPGEVVLPPAGGGPNINLSGEFMVAGNNLKLVLDRTNDNAARRRGPI